MPQARVAKDEGPSGLEIVPLGEVRRDVVERLARRLESVFGCVVAVARPQGVPQAAYQSSRGQHNASLVLNAIRPVAWKRGWKRLGVIDADIFSGALNFVFGQADLCGSTAVISLERLKNEFYDVAPDDALFIERGVKEAVHEIGHTLGLVHCKNPACVMYFSNSLVDTDRKGTQFCGECRRRKEPGGEC